MMIPDSSIDDSTTSLVTIFTLFELLLIMKNNDYIVHLKRGFVKANFVNMNDLELE